MNEHNLPLASVTVALEYYALGSTIATLVRRLIEEEPVENRTSYYEDILYRDGLWVQCGRTSPHRWLCLVIAPSHDGHARLCFGTAYNKIVVRSNASRIEREQVSFDAVTNSTKDFARKLARASHVSSLSA